MLKYKAIIEGPKGERKVLRLGRHPDCDSAWNRAIARTPEGWILIEVWAED